MGDRTASDVYYIHTDNQHHAPRKSASTAAAIPLCGVFAHATETRDESRHACCIVSIFLAETGK